MIFYTFYKMPYVDELVKHHEQLSNCATYILFFAQICFQVCVSSDQMQFFAPSFQDSYTHNQTF